jgi:hypothetical protein
MSILGIVDELARTGVPTKGQRVAQNAYRQERP